jgi:hypothetical protein
MLSEQEKKELKDGTVMASLGPSASLRASGSMLRYFTASGDEASPGQCSRSVCRGKLPPHPHPLSPLSIQYAQGAREGSVGRPRGEML